MILGEYPKYVLVFPIHVWVRRGLNMGPFGATWTHVNPNSIIFVKLRRDEEEEEE